MKSFMADLDITDLISDIIQLIFDQLNYQDKFSLLLVCKFLYNHRYITKLKFDNRIYQLIEKCDNISILNLSVDKVVKYLRNDVTPYCCVRKMYDNFEYLPKFHDVQTFYDKINNNQISHLKNLTELYICNNPYVTNINYLTNLRILDASGKISGISDNSISELRNLTYLDISWNMKITNLNHLTKLTTLIAKHDQYSILHPCYQKYLPSNEYIFDNDGLASLTNLLELNIQGNRSIANINHLTNLTKLDVSENFMDKYSTNQIRYDQISSLTKLVELNAKNNINITNVNHFSMLQVLHIKRSGVEKSGISSLKNLKYLDIFFI